MVRKESVYRAYVAMCRAEGWPTRLPAPALGKMVKRAFPFVGTRRLGPRRQVKQYYVGLCPRTSGGGEWERHYQVTTAAATATPTLVFAPCLPASPASNPVHKQEPEEEPEEEPGQEECCCCCCCWATGRRAENRCGEDNGVASCREASSCTMQSDSCVQRLLVRNGPPKARCRDSSDDRQSSHTSPPSNWAG
jgi:hypothetical protein